MKSHKTKKLGRPATVAPPLPAAATVAQVADLMNVTPERVRQFAKDGYVPTPKKGLWRFVDTIKGGFRFYQQGSHQHAQSKQEKLIESVRIERAEAEIKEMQSQEKRGTLMSTALVNEVIRDCYMPIRQRLLALPNELSTRCNPTDPEMARLALTSWTTEALTLIRNSLPKR